MKALDAAPATRAVLCLFEGVCTGAADGFGRMAKRPALTLTHLGPGFANGIANLHNARRAHSPIINLIGDHASWHSAYDPPLHSDIDALARTVGWVGRSSSPGSLTADVEEAWGAAMGTPRGVATLVVPSDFQSALVNEHSRPTPDLPRTPVSSADIADAARIVEGPEATILLIGGDALCPEGQILAAGIAAKGQHTRVMIEMFPARIERGAGIPLLGRASVFSRAGTGRPRRRPHHIGRYARSGQLLRLRRDSQRTRPCELYPYSGAGGWRRPRGIESLGRRGRRQR